MHITLTRFTLTLTSAHGNSTTTRFVLPLYVIIDRAPVLLRTFELRAFLMPYLKPETYLTITFSELTTAQQLHPPFVRQLRILCAGIAELTLSCHLPTALTQRNSILIKAEQRPAVRGTIVRTLILALCALIASLTGLFTSLAFSF